MKWVNECTSKSAHQDLNIKIFMTEVPSYRKPIMLLCKSVDWFLYDRGLHHERVKEKNIDELFFDKMSAATFVFPYIQILKNKVDVDSMLLSCHVRVSE